MERLKADAETRQLENVAFYDEIDPSEIPGLYAQCHIGLLTLDPRHRTHNIPGKLLTYLQCGLPVLARVNRGNDLIEIIDRENVGKVCTDSSLETLQCHAEDLLHKIETDTDMLLRCKALYRKLFSVDAVAAQVIKALVD